MRRYWGRYGRDIRSDVRIVLMNYKLVQETSNYSCKAAQKSIYEKLKIINIILNFLVIFRVFWKCSNIGDFRNVRRISKTVHVLWTNLDNFWPLKKKIKYFCEAPATLSSDYRSNFIWTFLRLCFLLTIIIISTPIFLEF